MKRRPLPATFEVAPLPLTPEFAADVARYGITAEAAVSTGPTYAPAVYRVYLHSRLLAGYSYPQDAIRAIQRIMAYGADYA